MKKLIVFLLFALLLSSCRVYEIYPEMIIRYKGKCWRMRGHRVTGNAYRIKKSQYRIMRKKQATDANRLWKWEGEDNSR
jgi:hypothetical protein